MSIELPVATRHHRDMTEKLLKATLNPNKQQQHKGYAHTSHSHHTKEPGQDNVTNINTGSGVRRIIFKRQQCMYKSEQRSINENLLIRNAHAIFGYSQ